MLGVWNRSPITATRSGHRWAHDRPAGRSTFTAGPGGALHRSEGTTHSPRTGASVISAIISAVIVGAIIGALGRLVVPGRQNISIWVTIAIGIVAALIGTFIA